MELNRLIWSRLPSELLLRIIELTKDEGTTRTWCQATKGSAKLYDTAMTCMWGTTTIDSESWQLATRSRWEEAGHSMRRLDLNIRRKREACCEFNRLSKISIASGRCDASVPGEATDSSHSVSPALLGM